MKKFTVFLATLLLCLSGAYAQQIFSDSIQVSLLTCGQGVDAYERFGHTAVRITDLKQPSVDIVFHYGVFSFETPHFVWRFTKGETDYQLGAEDAAMFIYRYQHRGLSMIQQTLDLDSLQAAETARRLIVNYAPQNRVYRYNYFFDNCATRPFHLINAACNNRIAYDTVWMAPTTYRSMVRQKTHSGTWLDFGITLAIGMGADREIGLNQQVFLPDYLAAAYDNATIDGRPLIVRTDTLMQIQPKVQQAIDAQPGATDPLCVMTLLLLTSIALLANFIRQTKHDSKHPHAALLLSNLFDTLLLLATGIAASILWFLLLGSEHPTVNENLNCMWLWPTNLLFCVIIWIKSAQFVQRIYFLSIFAALIAYITAATNGWQESSSEVLLLAATCLFRAIERAFFHAKEPSSETIKHDR